MSSIPRLGRSLGEGNGYPLQYSWLENSMNRGPWQAIVHDVPESDMTEQLPHTHTHIHTHMFYILHYVININNDQEEYSYIWYHKISEEWLYSSWLICREYRLIQGGWIVLILFSFNGGRANKLFIVHWIWWPGSNQIILWTQGRVEVKSLRWIVSVAL